ncbi:restriction endonuclease subunit S [Lacihabitans lacunae]|uniref:Restriction endonuclease subunit S n=1 Tax=Lacihabitans lacunae TaxID=1028214 RepID=A0ABV7Z3A8_9BACT
MTNWKEYKLSDLMDVIGGGTPKTKIPKYWDGDIPWLSVVDFGNAEKKVFDTEKKITELGLNNSSTKILKKGQIIISARGTVGELAVLGRDMAFNQSCYGLNAKSEICTNDFLYYLMKCKISELKRNAHGAVFDTITRNTFDTVFASVPDIETQTAIAEILSSLDDKIELNNKINQELENLAQTLFKQWFIDFEFPNENGEPYKSSGGEMIDSELGEIPKGWEVGVLNDILEVKGGTTPSTKEPLFWDGEFHWTSPRDLSNLHFPLLLNTDKKVTKEGLKKISSGLLPKGTLLLSSRAPIGYLAITEIETAINQGYIAINAKQGFSNLYILYWIKSNMDLIIERANGSTFLEISKTNFKQINCLIPQKNILNEYMLQIDLLFEQLRINLLENQELTNLRDTLLPKLISGELQINEI